MGSSDECAAARARLLRALAQRFRVYAPAVPDAVASIGLSQWLSGFVDGLGMSGLGLVVTGRLGAAALAHTLSHPWQVARLALLPGEPAAQNAPDVLRDQLAESGQPILILPGGCRAPRARAALVGFLAASDDPR